MDWRRFWEQLPPITRNIIAINLVVGLATFVLKRFGLDLVLWLGLWNPGYSAFHGAGSFHIWQPVTYMFLHSGVSHWFCNMFAVLIFGPVIENEWGAKKYLLYYIVCGIGAAIVQILTWNIGYPHPACTIGASGAVFGILFAYAWLFPEQKMFLLFIPIPIPARWFVGLYAFFELTAGVAAFSFDNVAHFAHLGGMLFGYLLIKFWQHQSNHRNRFKDNEGRDFSGYHYKEPLK